jgi:uncharacterized protein YceK
MKSIGKLRAAPLAATATVVLLLSGCTSVRNDLGTSSSVCYGSLPAATSAVHARGRLDGVRLVTVSSLRTSAPHLYRAAISSRGGAVSKVCLVAFSGDFRRGAVARPIGRERGSLAVVELVYPGERLSATRPVARPPPRFCLSHSELP